MPTKTGKQQEIQKVSFLSLFRFADRKDTIFMIVGTICACATGAALPSFALLLGNMINSFGDPDQMVEAARRVMFNFIQIGAGTLVAGWGMFGCWMITGERQGIACRKQYLKSLLKQEIGWFDTINQSQLASDFATDSFAFQEAIGEKVSTFIMMISMFIAAFAIAFSKGWTMTLVCIAALPAVGFGGYLYSITISKRDTELEKQYSKAGGKAEQAIAGIKTVKQLNGQQYEAEQYAQTLTKTTANSTKYGVQMGVGIGSLFGFLLFFNSLGFWFGSHCVQGNNPCPTSLTGGKYQAGDVLVVFFSILIAGFNFTQLTPAIKKVSEGRTAAARIYKIIDRQPLIISPQNGLRPQSFCGVFRFEGVSFAYPKDPSKKILDNFDLEIRGKSTAFVGNSGCGKSTIFQLMMRFYDPDHGRITLDGVDLKELDLFWLRDQIGYVGQEPFLFSTTLKENLLFGKEDATDAQIEQALKKAEAYDFVQALKGKLDTFVGTAGSQISGGQKQRIAIARALLKNPKILLFDEATSALDRRNEKNIQRTLNKIAQEKTTITIAHRIRTIMSCEEIFVISMGKVLEHGRFNQLALYKNIKIEDEDMEVSPMKERAAKNEGFIQMATTQNFGKIQIEAQAALKNKAQETDEEREKKERQQLLKIYEASVFKRLFTYTSHRKCLFVIGVITCIINGIHYPIVSIYMGKMFAVLLDFKLHPEQARKDANLNALIYLIMGVAAFVINIIQQGIFTTIGQEATQKIRNQTYLKILKMPISWMDNPKNSSGALSARLASDCRTVNGITTTYVPILIKNIANLAAGLIISFIYEWRTSLVSMGLIPFMILAGAIQMQFTTGLSAKNDSAYRDSSNLITQSLINIRTVTSFGYEGMISNRYSKMLQQPLKIAVKKGNISGILFGISQFIMFIVFALIFYFGAVFTRDYHLNVSDVFTAIYSIMFAGIISGSCSHFMPDVAAAKNSAANIFSILDSMDEDQIQIIQKSKLLTTPIKGNIEIRNGFFKYQSRMEYVFKNFNIDVKSGQKIGFVGTSGCGKSTVFQLLQRFYDLQSGQILVDGVSIKDYDIHHLRSSFGVVSQQPTLFNDTIANNIRYNLANISIKQIVAAANAAYFNPEQDTAQQSIAVQQSNDKAQSNRGFEKNVGVKGSHISGGQKQRVAISRAIIRKPTVLLLDEATSALDSTNQKRVQASLDQLMEGKTCIQIAHRIDTIINSDVIMVFEKGEIIQRGTYDQLISLRGHFYKLQMGLQFI